MSKTSKIFLGIIIILTLILFILCLIFFSKPYDVSNFRSIEVSDALDFFTDNKTHVIFIGYSSCDACKDVLSGLEKAQIKYEYMTNYIDLKSVDFKSEDWENFTDKLDMEVTVKVNEKDVTDTFGNILNKYGMTPTVLIIENNKQKGGFIGAYKENNIIKWVEYVLNTKES